MKKELTDAEIMENFDALFWDLIVKPNKNQGMELSVIKSAYKYAKDKKITQIENLGFKYYVCMFKNDIPVDSVEVWSAILGDPHKWVDSIANMGYNGVLIKKQSIPKKTINSIVRKMLANYGIEEKMIRLTLNKFKLEV